MRNANYSIIIVPKHADPAHPSIQKHQDKRSSVPTGDLPVDRPFRFYSLSLSRSIETTPNRTHVAAGREGSSGAEQTKRSKRRKGMGGEGGKRRRPASEKKKIKDGVSKCPLGRRDPLEKR